MKLKKKLLFIIICFFVFYDPLLFYRPANCCRMRYESQFCPVCTYHLEATFRIRTSTNDPKIKELICDENPDHYEWEHYSIEDFSKDLSADVFARMN